MTCKDCIHYEACHDMYYEEHATRHFDPEKHNAEKECGYFKDRSRFVELPVKISDKYYMDIKQAKTVSDMLLTISQNFEYNGDNSSAFKSYFIGVGDAIESCLKALTPFWKEKK